MCHTGNNGIKNLEMMVPLNLLCNVCKICEIPPLNCEIIVKLNWYTQYVISSNTLEVDITLFVITDTKLYVLVASLSTQGNSGK